MLILPICFFNQCDSVQDFLTVWNYFSFIYTYVKKVISIKNLFV